MAEKKRLLDLWLVDGGTVYRDVPFTVVTDWIQQGRLLPEDRARISGGQTKWVPLGNIPAFLPYFPKAEPQAVEDRAEALEPVEVDFHWKKPVDDEQDDPDMIPLIDVTLVLLIFFMMTASVQSGLFSPIDTPAAKHQVLLINEGYWLGIEKDKAQQIVYSLGKDSAVLEKAHPAMEGALAQLRTELDKVRDKVSVRIRADRNLSADVVQKAHSRLKQLEASINKERAATERVTLEVTGEVSEPIE